jgi:uncharacterized cupredoxin-like copper-binding protein
MKKTILLLAAAVLVFSCKENATSKIKTENVQVANQRDEAAKKVPVMSFEKTVHDFGMITQGTPQEYTFKFTNTGDAPLVITSATSSCGCTVPSPPKDPIAPGDSGELLVKFNGAGANLVTKDITVTANTAKGREVIKIKAFVNPKDGSATLPLKVSK